MSRRASDRRELRARMRNPFMEQSRAAAEDTRAMSSKRAAFLPDPPKLSVIIVSADSGPSLRDCVRSVLTCALPLELILIDNGSSDGVPQAVARAWESDARVRVLYNRANLGFGAAVNLAAAQANAPWLLVLNPDCVIGPEAIDWLLALGAARPLAGVIGAVVCDPDGSPDPASLRRDPLLRRALATLLGRRDAGIAVTPLPEHAVLAEQVSGAVLLLHRLRFLKLGGFDTGFFLHCEDLDLCRRMRDVGHEVWLAGDVRVTHGKGGSSRHRPVFVSWHKHRGMWRWFRRHDPAARNPLLAGLVWLGIGAHFLLKLPGQWLRSGQRSASGA